MNRVLIALILSVVYAPWASASDGYFLLGNELIRDCQNQASLEAHAQYDSSDYNQCLGYVMGISDTLGEAAVLGDTTNVTAGQLVKIVLKYAEDHPQQLNRRAAWIVGQALRKAFPK